MKTSLREDEIIRFMTRAPQVHMMEIIGEYDFDPEEIELEEYVGRIDSVIGEDEALLVTTLSPVDGFRCIATAACGCAVPPYGPALGNPTLWQVP